jgi:Tetratricopeptide repeat
LERFRCCSGIHLFRRSRANLQGKYGSEAIYVALIPLQRRAFGGEDNHTLSSVNNLAAIYHQQRKYAEAEPLYLNVLEVRRRVNGEEHPHDCAI